jgi:hypothetical protein
VPTAKTGLSRTDRAHASIALRLVSTVAATRLGAATCLELIDKIGATTGVTPSAVRWAAVRVAPGSGLVINTRFKTSLLSKSLRSMMCAPAWARRYRTLGRIAKGESLRPSSAGPGQALERSDESGSGDRDVLR